MARQIPGVNRLVGTFVNPVVNSIDVDGVVQNIDLDELIARVDIQRIVDRLDLDTVIDRVDINRLLKRVDVSELVRRIDLNEVLQQVDVNALAQRVDVDALLDNVDIPRVIDRVQVANTAGAVALSALDLARQHLVSIDTLMCYAAIRWVRRIRVTGADPDGNVSGRPAGPFTRLLSFVIDSFAVAAIFSLGLAMISYLAGLFTHHTYHPQHEGFWWAVGGAAVAFVYFWMTVALWGQTLGQALLGLRVIKYGGGAVGGRSAFVRILVFPFSFILGLGFIGIVFGRERRAWHDHAARTQVVYDWGGRKAYLPGGVTTWLSSRQQLPIPGAAPDVLSEKAA